MDHRIRDLVNRRASANEIKSAAQRGGMVTLREGASSSYGPGSPPCRKWRVWSMLSRIPIDTIPRRWLPHPEGA
jgi:hypothetical protein